MPTEAEGRGDDEWPPYARHAVLTVSAGQHYPGRHQRLRPGLDASTGDGIIVLSPALAPAFLHGGTGGVCC